MANNVWSFGRDQEGPEQALAGQQTGELVQLPDGSMGTLAELVAALGQEQQNGEKQKNYVPASLQAMIRSQGAQPSFGGMDGMGGFGRGGFGRGR